MHKRRFALALALAVGSAGLALAPSAASQQPPIDVSGLGQGRFSTMHALVEKTFLGVDAYEVSIAFDAATAHKIEAIARGKPYSEELAARIADIAYRAKNAYVRTVFKRNVSYNEFLRGITESLAKARDAGMITASSFRHIVQTLPRSFAFLKDRGVRKHEQLLYRVRPDGLRTVYLDLAGKALLDQDDKGAENRRAALAGFLAPKTDPRKPLIRSLFRR